VTEAEPKCAKGSIIECENATLGEEVPLNGAPFSLVYRSDRIEENPLPYGVDLPVGPSDKKALDKLLRIDVMVDVAGRRWVYKLYPGDPGGLLNRVLHIQWDGRNLEGKRVRGAQVAALTVSYAYEATYTGVPTFGLTGAGSILARTSASGGGSPSAVVAPILMKMPTRREVLFTTKLDVTLGTFDWSGLGFGGWGVDKYHAWGNGKVFLGTGGTATPSEVAARVARRVPGTPPSLDPATSLGVTSNGTQYFVSGGKLWRHRASATSSEPLAVGTFPVLNVAVTRDDEIFACAGIDPSILYRVTDTATGVATEAIAGGGSIDGDGGSAKAASILCSAIAADRGYVFIAAPYAYSSSRVRRIDVRADHIETVAGCPRGVCGSSCPESKVLPDGTACIPGTSAVLATDSYVPVLTNSLAVGPDGSLYIAGTSTSNSQILRLDPFGRIAAVAGGTGKNGTPDEGVDALDAPLPDKLSVAVDRHGKLFIGGSYLSSDKPGVVLVVGKDGRIRRVAGTAPRTLFPDGASAAQMDIPNIGALAVGSDKGSDVLLVSAAEKAGARIFDLRTPIGLSDGDVAYGGEIFRADTKGRHAETLDAATGVVKWRFNHNSCDLLESISDVHGNSTQFVREPACSGHVVRIIGPLATSGSTLGAYGVSTLSYDSEGRLSRVDRSTTEAHSFTYFAGNQFLKTFTEPGGDVVSGETHTFNFDVLGRLVRDDQPSSVGGSTSLARTVLADGWRMTLTSALGHSKVFEDRRFELKNEGVEGGSHFRKLIAPDGTETRIVVHPSGTKETLLPSGTRILEEQIPDPRFGMQAPTGATLIQLPSGKSRLVEVVRSGTDPTVETVTVWSGTIPKAATIEAAKQTKPGLSLVATSSSQLNSNGDGTFILTKTSAMGRVVGVAIDTKGRVAKVSLPDPAWNIADVRLAYDGAGSFGRLSSISQESSVLERRVDYFYGPAGHLGWLSANTPVSTTTFFTLHDSIGRVKGQLLPGGGYVGTTFDLRGNLESVTPPGKPAHQFTSTMIDQMSTYTAPATTPPVAGRQTKYLWNAEGALSEVQPPDGNKLHVFFEGKDPGEPGGLDTGRLKRVIDDRAPATGGVKVDYDVAGRVRQLGWPGGAPTATLSFTYEDALLSKTTWSGSTWGTTTTDLSVERSYDALFRLAGLTVASQPEIKFGYDADGLLTSAGDMKLVYKGTSPDGKTAKTTLLESTSVGSVQEAFDYSRFGELRTQTAKFGGTNLLTIDYEPLRTDGTRIDRDKLGRIVEREERVRSGSSKRFKYEYDAAGRLSKVSIDGVLATEYEYDGGATGGNGNCTKKTTWSGGTATTMNATYDEQDRLLTYGATSYAYYDTGEVKTKTDTSGTTTYTWDGRGNLLAIDFPTGTPIERVEYIVDALGRRVGKRVKRAGGSAQLVKQWVWEGSLRIAAEIDVATAVVTRFVYGRRANVPEYLVRSDGKTARVLTDHLGSVRLVVDTTSGGLLQQMEYDAYGNVTSTEYVAAGWSPIPFGFAGGLFDRDTKLVRFGARDYDAEIGRWIGKDPSGLRGDLNLYGYAAGDAVNFIDIAGRTPESANSLIDAVTANRPMTGADLDTITWIRLMQFRHPNTPSEAWDELKRMRDDSHTDLRDVLDGFGERPGVVAAEHYLFARFFSRYATPLFGLFLSSGYHHFKLGCGALTKPIPGGPWYGVPLGSGPVTPPNDLQFSWGSYGSATAWSGDPE